MSAEYKQTLARFEQAVRDHAFKGTLCDQDEIEAIEKEYEDAKRALVRKLQYRTATAEARAQQS